MWSSSGSNSFVSLLLACIQVVAIVVAYSLRQFNNISIYLLNRFLTVIVFIYFPFLSFQFYLFCFFLFFSNLFLLFLSVHSNGHLGVCILKYWSQSSVSMPASLIKELLQHVSCIPLSTYRVSYSEFLWMLPILFCFSIRFCFILSFSYFDFVGCVFEN